MGLLLQYSMKEIKFENLFCAYFIYFYKILHSQFYRWSYGVVLYEIFTIGKVDVSTRSTVIMFTNRGEMQNN